MNTSISLFSDFLQAKLDQRHQDNTFRRLVTTANAADFTSNDYLGLARSPELFQLIKKQIESLPYFNGATGSRLLSGNSEYTMQVEQKLAAIFKGEAALIYNSGYAANQGVLSCIVQKEDTLFYDELAHACIRDGARLSFASRYAFRHNDLNDLEAKLKRATGRVYIAVESIYSMDGDSCPLEELVTLAEKYNAIIILDEAHGTGVEGPNGSGLAVKLGLENKIPVRIYTFGKAMGVHGAVVVGSKLLIDYLINFSRTFIFTTAMSPHSVASIECAFDYLKANMNLQSRLNEGIQLFTKHAKKINLATLPSSTQIQGVVVPGNEIIKEVAKKLQHAGFDARPILSPTVAKGSERIRLCLHTYNTDNEITSLLNTLQTLL